MEVSGRDTKSAGSARRRRLVRWILIVRAVVVLSLGLAFLISGDNRTILGNLLSTFWLAGALLTLAWARTNWGRHGSRLGLIAGVVGVAAAVIGLARFLIEGAISADAALAVLGVTAVLVGALRLVGAYRDDAAERPRLSRRIVLGLGEVVIGVVLITTDEVSPTVTTSIAIWALLGGTIMLIDALGAFRTREEPA